MTTLRVDLVQTGRNIQQMRLQASLSVRDLQMVFGFSTPQAIYKWQNGDCLPAVENLLVLAGLFHTDIEGILAVIDDGPADRMVG